MRDSFKTLSASPFAPVLFFAALSLIYFYGFAFTDDVIVGMDYGAEYNKGGQPFSEKLDDVVPGSWIRLMGGMPESSALRVHYFPLSFIYLLTTDHRYFGWRFIFAMFCAGYFTFLFARGLGLRRSVALFAGAAFACAPTVLSFTLAGQYAKMSAISFFPLLAWGIYRGLETRAYIYFLVAGIGIGLAVYTPHIQIVYYSLIGLGTIALCKMVQHYRRDRDWRAARARGLLAIGAVVLGLAIGSEGTFPQWYASTLTKRGDLRESEQGIERFAATWALHAEEFASLVVPEFVHFNHRGQQLYWGRNPGKLNSEYFGIAVLFLAALALAGLRGERAMPVLVALFLVGMVISLGANTPLYSLLYHYVPGIKDLRVPGMIAFLMAFPACGLAALALQRVLYDDDAAPRLQRVLWPVAAALAAVLVPLALAPQAVIALWTDLFRADLTERSAAIARANVPHLQRGALLGALWLGALSALTWLALKRRVPAPALVLALLVITAGDTWRINKQFLNYDDPDLYPRPDRVNGDILDYLNKDPSLFRVLPLPNHHAVPLYGIDLTTGRHDFTLPRYDRVIHSELLGNLKVLSLLNTKYIVATDSLAHPALAAVGTANGLHVYHNPHAYPWVYLAARYRVETDEERLIAALADPSLDLRETVLLEQQPTDYVPAAEPGRIKRLAYDIDAGHIAYEITTAGTGFLVVSENHHQYWHAYVDGEERPLLRANYVWKAVEVPPGTHRVELRYRDPITAVCRWVTVVSSALSLALVLWHFHRRRADEE